MGEFAQAFRETYLGTNKAMRNDPSWADARMDMRSIDSYIRDDTGKYQMLTDFLADDSKDRSTIRQMDRLMDQASYDMQRFNRISGEFGFDPVFKGDLYDRENVNAQLHQLTDEFLSDGRSEFVRYQKDNTGASYEADGSVHDKTGGFAESIQGNDNGAAVAASNQFWSDAYRASGTLLTLGSHQVGGRASNKEKECAMDPFKDVMKDVQAMNDMSAKAGAEPVFHGTSQEIHDPVIMSSFVEQYARERMDAGQRAYDMETGYSIAPVKAEKPGLKEQEAKSPDTGTVSRSNEEFLRAFKEAGSTICADKLAGDSMEYVGLANRQIGMRPEPIDESDMDDMGFLLSDTVKDMQEFNEVCRQKNQDPVFTGDLNDRRNVNAQLLQMADAFLSNGQKALGAKPYAAEGPLTDKVEDLSVGSYRIAEHTGSYSSVESFRDSLDNVSQLIVSLGGAGNTSWQKERLSEEMEGLGGSVKTLNDLGTNAKKEPVFTGDVQDTAALAGFAGQYTRESMRDWQNKYDSEMGYERIADRVLDTGKEASGMENPDTGTVSRSNGEFLQAFKEAGSKADGKGTERFVDDSIDYVRDHLVNDSMSYIRIANDQTGLRDTQAIDWSDQHEFELLLTKTGRDMGKFNQICERNGDEPLFTGDLKDARNVNAQLMQMSDAFLKDGCEAYAGKGSTSYASKGSLTDKVERLAVKSYGITAHEGVYQSIEGFRKCMEFVSPVMVSLGGSDDTSWQKGYLSENLGTLGGRIREMNARCSDVQSGPVFTGNTEDKTVLAGFAQQYARENMRDWQNKYDSEMGYERIADKILGTEKQAGMAAAVHAEKSEPAKEMLAVTVTEKQVFDFKNDDSKKVVSIRDPHSASGFGSFTVDADAVKDAGQTKKGVGLKSVELDPDATYSVSEQRGKGENKYFYHRQMSGQEVVDLYSEGKQASQKVKSEAKSERIRGDSQVSGRALPDVPVNTDSEKNIQAEA